MWVQRVSMTALGVLEEDEDEERERSGGLVSDSDVWAGSSMIAAARSELRFCVLLPRMQEGRERERLKGGERSLDWRGLASCFILENVKNSLFLKHLLSFTKYIPNFYK